LEITLIDFGAVPSLDLEELDVMDGVGALFFAFLGCLLRNFASEKYISSTREM